MTSKVCIALVATALLALASQAHAVEPAWTTITCKDMCCGGCVKKIAARLYVVRGVKEVRVNLEKKTVFVAPLDNKTLSPKAMWEAIEKADDQPIRLAGPSGVFTKKPRF